MSEYASFQELGRRMRALYDEKAYAEGLAMLEREAPHYPEQETRLNFWLMCFATLAGQPGRALSLFETALERGLWFPRAFLRNDPDLAALQGDTEFERLVGINEERVQVAEADVRPYREVLAPAAGTPPGGLLVALHANASNVALQVDHWRPATRAGWTVLLPQSTQISGQDTYVWDDRAWAFREVLEHLGQVAEAQAFAPAQRVVGGFSMGGQLAPDLVLSGALPARGFICMGPYIPEDVFERWEAAFESAAARGVRGFILIGDLDAHCVPGAEGLYQRMLAHGMRCEIRRYLGLDHEFPSDFDRVLLEALAFMQAV